MFLLLIKQLRSGFGYVIIHSVILHLTRIIPLRVAGFEVDVIGLVGFVLHDFEFLPSRGVAQECLSVFFAGDPGCGILDDYRDSDRITHRHFPFKVIHSSLV